MSSSSIAFGILEGYALIWVGFVGMVGLIGLFTWLTSQK